MACLTRGTTRAYVCTTRLGLFPLYPGCTIFSFACGINCGGHRESTRAILTWVVEGSSRRACIPWLRHESIQSKRARPPQFRSIDHIGGAAKVSDVNLAASMGCDSAFPGIRREKIAVNKSVEMLRKRLPVVRGKRTLKAQKLLTPDACIYRVWVMHARLRWCVSKEHPAL